MSDKDMSEKNKKVKKNDNKKVNLENNKIKNESSAKKNITKESSKEVDKVVAIGKEKSQKSLFNLTEVIIIMVVTTLFGLLLGALIAFVRIDNREVSCSAIRKDMVEFAGVYDGLLNEYYGEIDKEKLMEAAIKGMLGYLGDPYSAYIDKDSAASLDDSLNGSFIGIGVEIVSIDGSLPTVVSVFDNSPASKAGILVGDVLTKVEGKDLTGLSGSDVASLIKTDKKGEKVKIAILRGEETKEVELAKDVIELKSVYGYQSAVGDEKVGVLSITTFAKNTPSQFKEEYEKLKKDGVTSLIIDVRNNSGGYLSSANTVASLFLNKGDVIYQKESDGEIEKFLSETGKEIDMPVVILTNVGTASAAEVFVAALKENLNVSVVGNRTYGKGTVQKMHSIASTGAYVKYTVQVWLTPSGVSIDGVGIEPTVRVDLSEEFLNNPIVANDNQLQQALQLLGE